MKTKDMIKAIYEAIANKALTFGCLINFGYGIRRKNYAYLGGHTSKDSFYASSMGEKHLRYEGRENDMLEIIGHPVMIGDVLEWSKQFKHIYKEQRTKTDTIMQYLPQYWDDMSKSIDFQSTECIERLYNNL